MARANLDETTVDAFRNQLHGAVLDPSDAGYDEAQTVWNAIIDKHPAVIARCTGAADAIAAVNFARDPELCRTVKAGGHNVTGNAVCNDGLMVDRSPMTATKGRGVDP